jgi:hypothetical protein
VREEEVVGGNRETGKRAFIMTGKVKGAGP